jgi:YgiT-type zinc finger domain-containing protein
VGLGLICETRDVSVGMGGTMIVPKMPGHFCPACGEDILNREEAVRLSEFLAKIPNVDRDNGFQR